MREKSSQFEGKISLAHRWPNNLLGQIVSALYCGTNPSIDSDGCSAMLQALHCKKLPLQVAAWKFCNYFLPIYKALIQISRLEQEGWFWEWVMSLLPFAVLEIIALNTVTRARSKSWDIIQVVYFHKETFKQMQYILFQSTMTFIYL